jgi:hypothetical protein
MAAEASSESLRTLFAYPFRQPGWQGRFLVGAGLILACFIIPIIPALFVYGYLLGIMRRAIRGDDLTLPAWQEWSVLLADGCRAFLVGLVYVLPGALTFLVGAGTYFLASLGLTSLGDSQVSPAAEWGFIVVFLAAMVVLFISMFLGMILSVLGAVPLPLALGNVAAKGKVAAAFYFRELWRMLAADPVGYFIAWVVMAGLAAITYLAAMLPYYTLVLACLVPIAAGVLGYYVMLVGAALFGQAYRNASMRLVAATPTPTSE